MSVINITELVSMSGATLTTDSLRVAKHFGKQHAHVLRAIRAIQRNVGPEFSRSNFGAASYEDAQGKRRELVRMTKDGFVLLAMGFSGDQAMRMKVAYISAFNAMAAELQQAGLSLWAQRLAIEARDANSFARAQIGAHLMLDRKRELPAIRDTRDRIDAALQPALFGVPAQETLQ